MHGILEINSHTSWINMRSRQIIRAYRNGGEKFTTTKGADKSASLSIRNDNIKVFMSKESIDIALVLEPWLLNNKIHGLTSNNYQFSNDEDEIGSFILIFYITA